MYDGAAQHVFLTYKFTGKERDSESGLDNFGVRYYRSSLGRFMSIDPARLSVHLSDPQALNRYVYARNNPLAYVDADGKDWAKAWQDVKIFANSLYAKVSVGAGLYGRGRFGSGEVKGGVNYKDTIKLSGNSGNPTISLTQSVEAGLEAGCPIHSRFVRMSGIHYEHSRFVRMSGIHYEIRVQYE